MKLVLLVSATAALLAAGPVEARSYGLHIPTSHRPYSYHHRSRSYGEGDFISHRHYTNVSGHWVHSPTRTRSGRRPAGATAHCSDGSWSFSEHARGTCSHHGGIG